MELINIPAEQYPFPGMDKQSKSVRDVCLDFQTNRSSIQEIILTLYGRTIEQEFFTPVDGFIACHGIDPIDMENANDKEELTLQNVPKAVNYLINEIAEMRAVLVSIETGLGLGPHKHRPIGLERVCEILDLPERTIKKMIRNNTIPYYKVEKKIYFFEDELIKWVEKSRVPTFDERYANTRRRY